MDYNELNLENADGVGRDRLVRFSTALAMTGIGRSNAYRLLATNRFPKPVKLGRKNLFSELELRDWIKAKLATRGGN